MYDADLGSGVFKKRIATGNKGKSAGARTLLATNLGDRWFYIYGFAKSQRSNIDSTEALQLKKLAAFMNMSPSTIRQWEQGVKAPSGAAKKLLFLIETKGVDVLL